MQYPFFAWAGFLACTVSALPNYNPSPKCKLYTDNFENLPTSFAGSNHVGTYNGITYQGADGRTKDPVTGATAGVIPHSGSKDIVAAMTQDLMQIGSVTLNPFANIIAPPSKAFGLKSFWFGCSTALLNSAASSSQLCVISVVGFNSDGQELPVLTYSYAPKVPLASPMVLAALPGTYGKLKNVTIGIASSTATAATGAMWFDDVTHCNY